MPVNRPLSVFVSSTTKDLTDHRAVARQVVSESGWSVVMMEDFGASTERTVKEITDRIKDADLVLVLVAFRKGSVPSVDQGGDGLASYTAIELQTARDLGKDVLIFMATDNWPGKDWESNEADRDWVSRFRAGLNQPAGFFSPEEDPRLPRFRNLLREALVTYKGRRQEKDERPDGELVRSARQWISDGSAVLFFGSAVHGSGTLSRRCLTAALRKMLDVCDDCFVSAAEHLQYRGTRDGFLDWFAGAIRDGTRTAEMPAIYRAVARQTARLLESTDRRHPLLFVSANWDGLLETALRNEGIEPTIICHVVRSELGDQSPSTLVFRPNETPEISWSDELDLRRDRCIVYRLLGGPSLNRDPRMDELLEADTVVATEADHLELLVSLHSPRTGVPTALVRVLQKSPLLFLGYPLDSWDYRLVAHLVFSSRLHRPVNRPIVAVRKPASPFEEACWLNLGAHLLRMDANRLLGEDSRPGGMQGPSPTDEVQP